MVTLGSAAALHSLNRASAAPCVLVQWAVGKWGHAAALQWAREHGYSEEEIDEARKCVAPPAVAKQPRAKSRIK